MKLVLFLSRSRSLSSAYFLLNEASRRESAKFGQFIRVGAFVPERQRIYLDCVDVNVIRVS